MQSAINRRTMLAGAAAVPVIALPAFALAAPGAADIDPIFAAMDEWRRVSAFANDAVVRSWEIGDHFDLRAVEIADGMHPEEAQLYVEWKKKREAGDSTRFDDPYTKTKHYEAWGDAFLQFMETSEGKEIERLQNKAGKARDRGYDAIYGCLPTTLAGAVAFMEFLVEFERDGVMDYSRKIVVEGEETDQFGLEIALTALSKVLRSHVAAAA